MRRWCMKDFQLYELPAMEEYLKRMAQKGWMLEEIKGGSWFIFQKAEPQQLTFSAEIVGNMSILGADECDEALDYRAYCEQAGWRFVCANRLVQIFYAKAGEEPMAIETDEKLKFDSIWKQLRKVLLLQLPLCLLWGCYLFRKPISYTGFLENDSEWFSRIILLACLIFLLCGSVRVLRWYRKGRRSLKKGEKVSYYGERGARLYKLLDYGLLLAVIGGFLLMVFHDYALGRKGTALYNILYFLCYLGLLLPLCGWIRKRGFSKSAYTVTVILGAVIFTFAAAMLFMMLRPLNEEHAEPEIEEGQLLTLEALGIETENEPFIRQGKSIFGSMQEYWGSQSFEEGSCTLDVWYYRSKNSWLLGKIKEEYVEWNRKYDNGVHILRSVENSRDLDGIQISHLKETTFDVDGSILEEEELGYLLEKEGAFCYLSFSGKFELSEEEILRKAAEEL